MQLLNWKFPVPFRWHAVVTMVMESTNHKARTMLLLRPLHSPTYLDINRNEQLSLQSLSIKQW